MKSLATESIFPPFSWFPQLFIWIARMVTAKVSALLGRIPSAVGYQPTLATDLASLQVGDGW